MNLTLQPGGRAALVGLNGSGKTGLLLAIVKVAPFFGSIQVGGVPVTPPTVAQVRRQVGFLVNPPEDQLLLPDVVENVARGLRQLRQPRQQANRRAGELLATLGAGGLAGRPVAELSHGQQPRVALAGALVSEPPLLLLDEPSVGLNPPGRRELARLLAKLPAALFIASHDPEFVARVCGRFFLLEGGSLAHDGPDLRAVLSRWETTERKREKASCRHLQLTRRSLFLAPLRPEEGIAGLGARSSPPGGGSAGPAATTIPLGCWHARVRVRWTGMESPANRRQG